MIINSAPQNEAIMSNVGQIGEFRIRNSAKAFNILSSGLYANKIKAIIRELSCNAVDSHVAASKADTPFDVHLPNSLEPWFSIRDYGTGLNHEQVTNIYTTYFESTKTDSNAFIGALGLGSKSPFSYTDNFTVTAVKDGSKRIYTAFINEQGVPSIALMSDHDTDEPNGVEVKFAVNNSGDYNKFFSEAAAVYKFFKLQPVVSGYSGFKVTPIEYVDTNIIPGVHTKVPSNYNNNSIAIMGNIAYPIDMPNAEANLGNLRNMLKCNLVMEFEIGELDFQASREGLSYVPSTIDAIKNKLVALSDQLSIHITQEANAISNLWDRAYFLKEKITEDLWRESVKKYIVDTKFELCNADSVYANKTITLNVTSTAIKHNIVIRSFHKSSGLTTCSNNKEVSRNYQPIGKATPVTGFFWDIIVDKNTKFIINDTKTGATGRAKHHYKHHNLSGTVFVIEKFNKSDSLDLKGFFASISNPPDNQISMASALSEKPRAGGFGRNVTILELAERTRGSWRRRTTSMVWADAGKADSFDKDETYYYVPLSGYNSLGKVGNVKELCEDLSRSGIFTDTIYGVRKADIEFIKTQKNWVELDEYVHAQLTKLGNVDEMVLVKKNIDFKGYFKYNVFNELSDSSPYKKFYNIFKDVADDDNSQNYNIHRLFSKYGVKAKTTNQIDVLALTAKYNEELASLKKRYQLLSSLNHYVSIDHTAVVEYISLIDEKKGV